MSGGEVARTRPGRAADTGEREAGGVNPLPAGRSEDSSLLTLLGLEEAEDLVYRMLVDRPDCEPPVLEGPLSGPVVARALESLVERGLASAGRPADGSTVRYRAASPVLALGSLLESRRAALRRVESFVGDLTERHRSAQAHASGVPVEVLTGPAAIRRRLLTMQRQAVSEVCTLVPTRHAPEVLTYEDNHAEADAELTRRGVTVRSVVERAGWSIHGRRRCCPPASLWVSTSPSRTGCRSSWSSWTGGSPCCR
ncbi:hypothetical protein ABT001_22885 [Streptomyces sp. NPDC002793]|uniref:TrmB family transcriptional regulator n=1 Tax=Streptomyces sp. NPDC002793 TaxID=3154432 RepID=UPI003319D012